MRHPAYWSTRVPRVQVVPGSAPRVDARGGAMSQRSLPQETQAARLVFYYARQGFWRHVAESLIALTVSF